MKHTDDITNLKNLLQQQRFGVLATQGTKEPYTSLIAYTPTNDFHNIIFVTQKNTTKYLNIQKNNRVSFLIDNRENNPIDISKAIVVTAFGTVHEIPKENIAETKQHQKKHPYLKKFINDKQSAIIKISVEKYLMVNKFQEVIIIRPDEL